MKTIDVVMVRVYITESSHALKGIVSYLKTEAGIRGISVFRAISGSGDSGSHGMSLLDVSLDLPLIIEFFDCKEKVTVALEHLSQTIKPEHVVFWNAQSNG